MRNPSGSSWLSPGAMRLAGIGIELAAAVGGACLLGYWIDRHFQTRPWGLLTCAAIAIVGGLYNMVRHAVHNAVKTMRHGPTDRTGRRQDERDA